MNPDQKKQITEFYMRAWRRGKAEGGNTTEDWSGSEIIAGLEALITQAERRGYDEALEEVQLVLHESSSDPEIFWGDGETILHARIAELYKEETECTTTIN